jgi:hypothetical protein
MARTWIVHEACQNNCRKFQNEPRQQEGKEMYRSNYIFLQQSANSDTNLYNNQYTIEKE